MDVIGSPIEQRNTGKGVPSAMLHFNRPLNRRQAWLLERMPGFDSQIIVPKKDANMRDLAALTAHTGNEYAMFTRKGERLIVRGNSHMTNIDEHKARVLASQGYRWSGHTHPGMDVNSMVASSGDYAILNAFRQAYSMIVNAVDNYEIFGGV